MLPTLSDILEDMTKSYDAHCNAPMLLKDKIKVFLPGYAKNDVKIKHIKTKNKVQVIAENEEFGKNEKYFHLTNNQNIDSATMENGLLLIKLKTKEEESTEIKIQ